MLLTRLKVAMVLFVLAGLVGTGGLVYSTRAEEPKRLTGSRPSSGGAGEDKGTDLKRQLDDLRSEYERLTRTEEERFALRQIEEGLKRLKKTTASAPAKKAAVDDFEKAFKKLQGQLRDKKPVADESEERRRQIIEQLDRIIREKLKEKPSPRPDPSGIDSLPPGFSSVPSGLALPPSGSTPPSAAELSKRIDELRKLI